MKSKNKAKLFVALVLVLISKSTIVAAGNSEDKAFTINSVKLKPTCSLPQNQDQKESSGLDTVVATLVFPFVEAGIKRLGEALKKAGADKDEHRIGYGGGSFYSIKFDRDKKTPSKAVVELESKCLIYGYGLSDGSKNNEYLKIMNPERNLPDRTVRYIMDFGFTEIPNLYSEFNIELSKDKTAFRLVPERFWIGQAIAKRRFSKKPSKKKRDLTLTVSFFLPAASEGGTAFASRTIVVENPGQWYFLSEIQLNLLATQWMPLPPLSKPVITRITALEKRHKDIIDLQKLSKHKQQLGKLVNLLEEDIKYLASVRPVNIRIDLHETSDGNSVLAAIGSIMSDNADDIAKPIVEAIDPAKRAEARKAGLESAISDLATESDARIAAINEVVAWQTTKGDDNSTDTQKSVALLKAKRACGELMERGFYEVTCSSVPD